MLGAEVNFQHGSDGRGTTVPARLMIVAELSFVSKLSADKRGRQLPVDVSRWDIHERGDCVLHRVVS